MGDKSTKDYVDRVCGEGSDKASGASQDELAEYIKKLRKRKLTELSRAEAVLLIKDNPTITLATNPPLHLGSTLAENLQRLRKECNWGYEALAEQVDLDKKLVIGHLKHGKGMHPDTLKKYARAFSDCLDRQISPEDLNS